MGKGFSKGYLLQSDMNGDKTAGFDVIMPNGQVKATPKKYNFLTYEKNPELPPW
ncbi:hypothetical protein GO730_30795 [Spirosoma sp. HMF3257]|uniref:hypothetical protein n=1 Tax=Spirosoma telluris TaxID=2183553 RepID=UPI0012FB6EDD|nr:hypothetical protein [Spirosoma telluris]